MSENKPKWKVRLQRSNYKIHGGNDWAPRLVHFKSYDLDDVIDRAARRGSALSADNLRHAAAMIMSEIKECLIEGATVNLPIGRLTPGVTGLWQFDQRYNEKVRAMNQGVVRYSMSDEMREALANPLLENVGMDTYRKLRVDHVHDISSGTINEWLTPGGAVIVQGTMLLMNGDLPERGFYLIDAETGESIAHIPPEKLATNTRTEAMFTMPTSLPEGDYLLRAVSQCTTNPNPLKKAREYTFPQVLTYAKEIERYEHE